MKKINKIAIACMFLIACSLHLNAQNTDAKMVNQYKEQAQQIAQSFAYPTHQPVVKNPGDYGVKYEDFNVETDDGVNLSGWLLKGKGDKVIVMSHVGTFSKYGLSIEAKKAGRSDALGYTRDVEFIPTAKHLVEAGYSVVMYDQRHHGESGDTPNGGTMNPIKASLDIKAIIEFAANHPDLKGKDIGMLSMCQGSLITMIAMTNYEEMMKEAGVKALAIIQPISPKRMFENFGFPEELVTEVDKSFGEIDISLDDLEPVKYAPNIFVPTLFVQGIMDPISSIDYSRMVYHAIPTEKEALWLPGDLHRFDAYNYFNEQPEKLLEWFNNQLN